MDMHTLDEMLTTEMTDYQWQIYAQKWRDAWAKDLVTECGMSKTAASERARYDWENYVGQEGYTRRDEMISANRMLKAGLL
jgi:hypothetical protein